MSLKQFYSELEKGLPAAAYLLHSVDAFQVKEAMLQVKASVPHEELDFRFHSFDMETPETAIPVEKMLDTANQVPFMGGRQILTVEGVQKLKAADMKPLTAYLENPSPATVLVMLYTGKPSKTALKYLKDAKAILVGIQERDLPQWITHMAKGKGFNISRNAIDRLIGIIGTEATGLLSSEIEKLASCGRKDIGPDDIEELVKGFGSYDAFDLVNALKARNARKVFDIYAVLSETQEPYSILGAINWHYQKPGMSPKLREKVFELLTEADFKVKSSGGIYPLEHLFSQLLKLSPKL